MIAVVHLPARNLLDMLGLAASLSLQRSIIMANQSNDQSLNAWRAGDSEGALRKLLSAATGFLGGGSGRAERHLSSGPAQINCASGYQWKDYLDKSYYFYEAQRSGPLPADNRVKWRKDSCLNDTGPLGQSLVGGHFDSGDHLKVLFPYGTTTAILAWGVLEFQDGYKTAGQLDSAMSTLMWASEFLMEAHFFKAKVQ
ncbi:hypothetical protein WJX84_001198, partial [Apatococcus fuscideae]